MAAKAVAPLLLAVSLVATSDVAVLFALSKGIFAATKVAFALSAVVFALSAVVFAVFAAVSTATNAVFSAVVSSTTFWSPATIAV